MYHSFYTDIYGIIQNKPWGILFQEYFARNTFPGIYECVEPLFWHNSKHHGYFCSFCFFCFLDESYWWSSP
jgi:hypothetical protein